MTKKVYTSQQAFVKAAKFCAYQERTQAEVRAKLNEYGFWGEEAEAVIARLIEENFINEERFARTYAGSKFRLKKWGRLKIKQALQQKQLSAYCIKAGLEEITDDAYKATLQELLTKKIPQIKASNSLVLKQKLVNYALSKGYESEWIWPSLNEVLERSDTNF